MTDCARLEQALGYTFTDRTLLKQALTHRSFGSPHNERLEFLGDGVLGMIIAAEIFGRFPQLREGEMSRLRAHLVREQTLHAIAVEMGLGRFMRLGEGEMKSGGGSRPSILADALEAVIGATFLDGGYDRARALVLRRFDTLLLAPHPDDLGKDPKTRLQEALQGRRLRLPAYSVSSTTGAAHDQTFEVECVVESLGLRTTGTGPTRRLAEQDAARKALEAMT